MTIMAKTRFSTIARKTATTGVILALVAGLSACGVSQKRAEKRERLQFDGYRYKVRLNTERDSVEKFSVEVGGATQSLNGAREAGTFKATEYCLKQFGLSDVDWVNGPDVDDAALVLDGDTLILSGACRGW